MIDHRLTRRKPRGEKRRKPQLINKQNININKNHSNFIKETTNSYHNINESITLLSNKNTQHDLVHNREN